MMESQRKSLTFAYVAIALFCGQFLVYSEAFPYSYSYLRFLPQETISRVDSPNHIGKPSKYISAMDKELDSESIGQLGLNSNGTGTFVDEDESSKNPNPILAAKTLIFPCAVGQVYSQATRKCKRPLLLRQPYGGIGR